MELTTKKITPPKRVCFRLKEARETRGISLAHMAKKLRTSEDHITALESCQFDNLPFSEIYQKNFIRSYIKILGLHPKHFIDQFVFEELRGQNAQKKKQQKKPFLSYLSDIPLIARFSVVMLLLITVVGYLALQVKHIVEPPNLAVYAPYDGMVTRAPLIRVQGKTESEVQVHINGKPIMNSKEGFFDEEISLSEGVNTLIFSAQKKHGKMTSETRHIVYKKEQQLTVSAHQSNEL